MRSWSKTLLVCVGVLALYGAQACTAGVPEADLNPQPLPPGQGTGEPARTPDEESADSKGGGTGGSMSSPNPSADAGTEGGDAAGGGDR